jgi:hypothetical protein
LRFIHNKAPTYDNLIMRGLHLSSMCSLCHKYAESSQHLFFYCLYAVNKWRWLSCTFNVATINNIEDFWLNLNRSWSP